MLRPEALLGTWELEAFEVALPDGRRVHPMGSDALGRLSYGADGWMSAMLSVARRPALSVPRLEAYARAPEQQKVAAFDTFLAYAGRYSVEGSDVVHHVELASVPNIVGAAQRRSASLHGDVLTLTYAVEGSRGTKVNTLRWRRA